MKYLLPILRCAQLVRVVRPHPDDAELGMGGTIVRLIQQGWKVGILDLTDGEPTPLGSRERRRHETDGCQCGTGEPLAEEPWLA